MVAAKEPHNIESRVGRLEGAVQSITRDVREMSHNIDRVASSLGDFKQEVVGHLGKLNSPRWPLIVSIATLVIGIFTLIGGIGAIILSGQSASVAKIEASLEKVRNESLESKYEDGKTSGWKEALVKKIEEDNKKTQEEIAGLKAWRLIHAEKQASLEGTISSSLKYLDQFEQRNYSNHHKE